MLCVVMKIFVVLSAIMLSVVVVSGIILSVVMLFRHADYHYAECQGAVNLLQSGVKSFQFDVQKIFYSF